MTVLNYIKAQGERIRGRHEGDTCVFFKGESAPVCRSATEILAELNAMEGLNERERAFANAPHRHCERSVSGVWQSQRVWADCI